LPWTGLACNDRRVHLLLLAQSADPTGLARGRWAAPPWAIGLAGGVLFALAVTFLVVRARRAKAAARGPGERA
jgi:cyanate permease